ncbi:MAG: hypothetical protein Q9183_004141 [Haloplaca sp. 2 TL-2023]
MIPKHQQVTYHWLIERPMIEKQARKIMLAHYYTAIKMDPDVKEVMIRADKPHRTTVKNGVIMPEPWHFTVSAKNADDVANETHSTAHGYTNDEHDWTVNKIKADQFTKPDKQINGLSEKAYWPKGLPKDPAKK